MIKLVRQFLSIFLCWSFFVACNKNEIVNTFQSVSGSGWQVTDTIVISANIEDTTQFYDLHFNLRHNSNYKYSNLYVLMSITSPDGEIGEDLLQFKLANADGKWLGKSNLGNLITHTIPLKKGIKFSKPGNYEFVLHQYMRQDPLIDVTHVGLAIVKHKE